MRYGSVCSGIEAASVAWEPLGWKPAWFAEVAPFPSAVLAHRYPDVPNLGDFTEIGAEHGPIDLLVGGTPCQSFSVAGRRAGLDDARGVLALEYLALARRLRPRWLVFENVPGLLSADAGAAWGEWLSAVAKCGYFGAWRILDAQYFGVAQRRRRLFFVGYLGDWRPPAAVLLELAGLCGHPAPCREAGARVANTVTPGAGKRNSGEDEYIVGLIGHGQYGEDTAPLRSEGGDCGGGSENLVVAFDTTQITSAQNRNNPQPGDPCHPLAAAAHAPTIAFDWQAGSGADASGKDRQYIVRAGEYAGALGHSKRDAVCVQEAQTGVRAYPTAGSLRANAPGTQPTGSLVQSGPMVRRLTPRECERLMAFPDDWTLVPYRGKMAADGPRYQALGNSQVTTVMRWIGERIEMVEQAMQERGA